jgi:hypothetical protein
MLERVRLLTLSTLVLGAVSSGPAMAAAPMGVAGTISGDYGNVDIGGGSADSWGISGAAAFGVNPMSDIGVQINGGYRNLSGGGGDADIFDVGGSVYWAPAMGRLGGTVAYKNFDFGGGFDANITAYGAFGEYFIGPAVTIGAHGGGWTGSFSGFSDNGGYVGGELLGYLTPNVALSGTIDFLGGGGDTTTYGVGAEWQFLQSVPLSVFGGYRNTDVGGGNNADIWFIGLRFYAGAVPMDLIGNHRNGTLGWAGEPLRGLQF